MKFIFSKTVRLLTNKNKVILANIANGYWVRMPKDAYDVFKYAIDNNLTLSELNDSLADEEDVSFISDLYYEMNSVGILVDKDSKQLLRNKIISLEMTHSCNLKCIHCCIDADGIVSDKKALSSEEIKIIFNKMIDWDPESIMLSGGEPMLRDDFKELLIYLRNKYKGEIIVSTNGTLINKENVAVLAKNADKIDMSLDGVDEESCSKIRGPGVFSKVMRSIDLLKDNGFKNITLSMATADKNEHLKEAFYKLNELLGTRPIIRAFSSVGRGKDSKSVFSDMGPNEVYIPEDYLSDTYNESFGVCSCSAGNRELFVAYNGDIYPCPCFIENRFKLGNILELDNLNLISEKCSEASQVSEVVESINPIYSNTKCKNCDVNLFCWTCPGEMMELRNNPEAFENLCKSIKPVLYKRVWG